MFDNDDDIFSTRDGAAQGKSLENRMLQSVGGKNAIRTKIVENADGSKTRLRTRGGMPEFVTDEPKKEKPNEVNFELVGEVANPPGTYSQYLENRGVKRIVWKGGAVSTTTIPIDEYIGSDGTEKWKKYRRYKTWTSADKRKVVYYSSAQYNSFNTTYPGGKSWPLYILDKDSPVPFNEDLQRCFGGDTVGHAYVRKEIGGVMQNVVVNTLTDIPLSSGIPVSGHTPPQLMNGSVAGGSRSPLSYEYLDPTGNKVVYAGYSVPETCTAAVGGTYVVPAKEYGVHVWDKTTGVLTEVWSPNSTGYSLTTNSKVDGSENPPWYSDLAQSISGHFELCISADVVGNDVLPIYAVLDFQSDSRGRLVFDGWPDNHNDTFENASAGGSWSGEFLIKRGDFVVTSKKIGGTTWTDSYASSARGVVKVASGSLSYPEQRVHAFTTTVITVRPGSDEITFSTELTLCDFANGMKHSYTFPPRSSVDSRVATLLTYVSTALAAWHNWSVVSMFDPYDSNNGAGYAYKQQYPAWNNKTGIEYAIPGSFILSGIPHGGDFRHGNPLTEFGPTPAEGGLCGSLFADDSTIALSVADPYTPTSFYNVIVDRKTKTVKTFDPGCVFYVIYKALKDLP